MEFIDLKAQYQCLKKDIDNNIREVIHSAGFILGSYVEEFEKKLAEYVGVKHAVSCSDGTAALQLIYMAYGIGAGDAVFCPDMTFIASVEPACLLGATPVFCEIDEQTYNIQPQSLERQIKNVLSERKLTPKAIVAVDFLGNPADYDTLSKIASKYGLILIEDAAQGMGASYHGKKCGSFGDIAATSFFPSKPLGCYGDGGAVFTNDDEMAVLLKSLRVHGKGKSKYDNIRIGINSRLDTIQAAVLLAKLAALPDEMEKRQITAQYYDEKLKDILCVPFVREGTVSSYAQYIVMAESEDMRSHMMEKLKEYQIPTLLYYPTPMHRLPVFKAVPVYGESFENTERYSKATFGIPFSPYLSEADQEKITQVLCGCCR